MLTSRTKAISKNQVRPWFKNTKFSENFILGRKFYGRRAPGFLKLLLSGKSVRVRVCVCVGVCVCVCVCPPPEAMNN